MRRWRTRRLTRWWPRPRRSPRDPAREAVLPPSSPRPASPDPASPRAGRGTGPAGARGLVAGLAAHAGGATSIEYGLVAALLALGVVTALGTVGGRLGATFATVADGFDGPTSPAPPAAAHAVGVPATVARP